MHIHNSVSKGHACATKYIFSMNLHVNLLQLWIINMFHDDKKGHKQLGYTVGIQDV